ncbi:thioesterase family protein [Enterococcus sp. AD013-P3]|uniref:thioesterase family protein n=1 Tax=Enterococcus sp. AD013-P3 TaxID=3411036 RepID=UPI003B95E56B
MAEENFEKDYLVTEDRTAKAMGSGGLDVLATPELVAMVENTCYQHLESEIAKEKTTVGGFISLEHVAPSPVGATITIKANLYERDGNKVVFSFSAYEGEKKVGKGNHERFIVDKDQFLAKMS